MNFPNRSLALMARESIWLLQQCASKAFTDGCLQVSVLFLLQGLIISAALTLLHGHIDTLVDFAVHLSG